MKTRHVTLFFFISSKIDILKLILIGFLYLIGGYSFIFPKAFSGSWEWLIILFTPLFLLYYLAPKFAALNIPFPLHPKDEGWMLRVKKITKTLTRFFWIIALPIAYLFFRNNETPWEEIFTGNEEVIRQMMEFLGPIIFVGATFYLFEGVCHFRKSLNPKHYSVEEIQGIKHRKDIAISAAKNL